MKRYIYDLFLFVTKTDTSESGEYHNLKSKQPNDYQMVQEHKADV